MTVLPWILQGILALMFIMAGFGKTIGSQMHIENFNKWAYPQWFRVVTGLLELIGAILLIVGYWNGTAALIGAAIFVAVGIGGVITHIRVKDTLKDTAMIFVLGLLALALLIILIV
jgi:putative oxidoreductase